MMYAVKATWWNGMPYEESAEVANIAGVFDSLETAVETIRDELSKVTEINGIPGRFEEDRRRSCESARFMWKYEDGQQDYRDNYWYVVTPHTLNEFVTFSLEES